MIGLARTSRKSIRRRTAIVVAAAVALLSLTSGVAQAASTTAYFPVSVSTSILAPNYASYGSLMVSTTCSRVTHYGAVSLAVQVPTLLTSGLTIETQVYVKSHSAANYNGSLYLARAQATVYPTGTISGFTPLIGVKSFWGGTGGSYDVGVWYRYVRDGQWTGWYFFQETIYSTVINSWNNVLETATCQT